MSKQNFNKKNKSVTSKPMAKPAGTAYPVKEQDLTAQQDRLSKAAAAGAQTLKFAPPPKPAEVPAAPQPAPARPLAAPQPTPPLSHSAAKPAPPSAPSVQQVPSPATAAKPRPAAPTPSAKPPAQAAPPAPVQKPTPPAPAQSPAKPQTVNVSFVLVKREARSVSVSGDFNAWSTDAAPMRSRGEGHWETTVALPPGRYQYKFVVDGEWIADPLAKENVANPHGTLNSVLEVRN